MPTADPPLAPGGIHIRILFPSRPLLSPLPRRMLVVGDTAPVGKKHKYLQQIYNVATSGTSVVVLLRDK